MNTYVYDAANRLISVNGQTSTTYAYGGLGDRHQQNSVSYTLDLNAGLTQVLSDGTNTYLYGNGRISQHATQTEYFLGDALGSVRQLADPAGVATLTQSYAPYGEVTTSTGTSQSSYGFTNEFTDLNGLVYLRARYYAPTDGRFISRDTWNGDYNRPLSLNRWGYVEGNPVNLVDPSGYASNEPFLNGYAEGSMWTTTVAFFIWKISGREVVYDFETLERAEFTVTGSVDPITQKEKLSPDGVCSTVLSVGYTSYFTHIQGFDKKGLENQWSGDAWAMQAGGDIPIPIPELLGLVVVPVGIVPFSTTSPSSGNLPNLDVYGLDFYLGAAGGAGVWDLNFGIAYFKTHTTIVKSSITKYDSVEEMADDIRSGHLTPGWPGWWIPPIRNFYADHALEWQQRK